MAKIARCDNDNCGSQAVLKEPYGVVPDDWYRVVKADEEKQFCGPFCLLFYARNEQPPSSRP